MGVTAEKRREGAEIITEKREHKIRIRISRLAVESRLLRLPVVVKQKQRKFPQVGLENFNEAHGVKSNPTISSN
ncbi:hypothetical protein WN943_012933 [Citrus x changshan-huyou]